MLDSTVIIYGWNCTTKIAYLFALDSVHFPCRLQACMYAWGLAMQGGQTKIEELMNGGQNKCGGNLFLKK